jgi:PAS domain S-box-containing protein
MKKKHEPTAPAKKRPERAAGTKKVQEKTGSPPRQEQTLDWEAAFRAIGSPAMIVAPDHTILSANDATGLITGKTEAELQGMKCWEVFHGPDATHPPQGCPVVRLLSSGKHETSEMEVSLNGGIYLVSCTPIVDDGGAISSIIHIATDITEKKRAEQRVRESEERYNNLYRNSAIGIFHSSFKGRFMDVNPALAKMLGYNSPEEVVTSVTNMSEQVYAEPPQYDVVTTALLNAGGILMTENRYRRRDGTLWYGMLHVRIVPDRQGRPSHYEGFVEDITDRRRAEEAIKQVSAYNRSLIEASLDPLVTINPDGKINDVNAATVQVTGYSREELIGTDFSKYFVEPELASAGYEKVFRDGSVTDYELGIRHRDGHVTPVMYNATVYRDESGNVIGVFAAARDVTDRKEAEELQERFIRELTLKKIELDRFTYTTSHDLKSPLLSIRAFLDLVEDDLKSGDSGRAMKDIARASESAEKLENLITTLLALSRSGRSVDTPVRIPFSDLAREAAMLLDASLHQHNMTLEIPDNLPEVSGDRHRLLQVMTDLLDNAVKFMGDQKEPRIEIGVRDDTGTPVFFVRDNGLGIKKEDQARVFGLYERFKPEIPGTGIGLATVKRIVEAHGGRIWIESEGEGTGTTVCFTLPSAGDNGTDKDNSG